MAAFNVGNRRKMALLNRAREMSIIKQEQLGYIKAFWGASGHRCKDRKMQGRELVTKL
jgi:hypothetical protein